MLRDLSGVKAAKPRLKPAKEELPELSREYLQIRNQQMRTKNLCAEMQLTERRGELIEKSLVERQAAYLLVALRQAILNVPQTWCRRLMGLNDALQVSRILREMAYSLLGQITDLPTKVSDPDWLSTLDSDGQEDSERIRPASGSQVRAEQARVKARRQNKARTEARRRAKAHRKWDWWSASIPVMTMDQVASRVFHAVASFRTRRTAPSIG